MASFQAKIGCKTPRKRENNNYRSVPFRSVPTRREIENSNKIAKKFQKLKNTIMASFQAKIGWKRRNRKFQKRMAKKLKNCKKTIVASFHAKIGWKMLRKRENKNCPSVPFRPDG